jgi:hypothetical protein
MPVTARVLPIDLHRTVIVTDDSLDPELAAAVDEACARVAARVVSWGSHTAADSESGVPVVVLAALPPGERQIPERLLRLATSERPDASLLLLCREPLVRPTVSLRNGRVTLVEPPLTARRIAGRLRILFTDEATGPMPRGPVACSEYQRPGYWVGALTDSSHEDPSAWLDQRRGLTTLVFAGASPDAERVGRVGELLARAGDAERLGVALAELLGDAGLIHLGPRGDEWLFYWPRRERSLWLCSPQRLPACWDLAATAQECATGCFRVPAANGDVVMSLPDEVAGWALGAARPGVPAHLRSELVDVVADGGPALLDEMESHLGTPLGPVFGLVVEAR